MRPSSMERPGLSCEKRDRGERSVRAFEHLYLRIDRTRNDH